MLYIFLQVVFDVREELKVHYNADTNIWSEKDLMNTFIGLPCEGIDCEPHHYPNNYGSPFMFTIETFRLL